jgi:hypothetical protein
MKLTLTDPRVREAVKKPDLRAAVQHAYTLPKSANSSKKRARDLYETAVRLGLSWPFKVPGAGRRGAVSDPPCTPAAPPPAAVADLVHCIVCGSGLDITRSGSITCLKCNSTLTATVKISRTITLSVINA